MSHDSLCDSKGTPGRIAHVECSIAELIVMTRYFPLLETRNRFANGDLWRGRARCAAACVRGHGGGRRHVWRRRQVLIGCILHALLFVSVCVQVQKGILTPCKRLITTQSYSIAKKRYGRRLRAYRIYK